MAKELKVSTNFQTQPPITNTSYSLEIIPADVKKNSALYVSPKGFSINDAYIEWLVNGRPSISNLPGQFNTTETKKGDKVQAKAIIHGKEILSNTVQIKNSTPEIVNIKILPKLIKLGDTVSVEVSGIDIDGDSITFIYEWTKNGRQAGKDKEIGGLLRRGDKVSIKVTPFDGEIYGSPAILHSEIRNMPPAITEDKKFDFNEKVYTRQIKASDPDGDTLTYSLKNAPAGMTINSSTGFIQWIIPPDFRGKAPVTASVTDGHGGETLLNFDVTIGFESR
ncbi:MAG: hypothetical protein HY756_06325 [Nitrospirae bacterium]|nr:hypothetical protein [Nitrospirota bacterium]